MKKYTNTVMGGRATDALRRNVWATEITSDGRTFQEYLESLPDQYRWSVQQAAYKLISAYNYRVGMNTKELDELKDAMKAPLKDQVPTLLKTREDVRKAGGLIDLTLLEAVLQKKEQRGVGRGE